MTKIAPLSPTERTHALESLQGWGLSADGRAISKRFSFTNYAEAFAFVAHISMMAERKNHHPDVTFGWGYVVITLTTHDVDGVSERDVVLAQLIEAKNHNPIRS